MSSLQSHFERLFIVYASRENTQIQLNQLAETLHISSRNTRHVINKLHALGWIKWDSRRGRGKHSLLTFLLTPDDIEANVNADSQLKTGCKDNASLRSHKNFGTFFTQHGIDIKIPYYRSLDQLNPLLPQRRTERHLIRQCFSGLCKYDIFQGTVIPDMSHYWVKNDEKTEWHFYLKKNLRLSNGGFVTASMVKQCISNAITSPSGKSGLINIKSVQVTGDHKISFFLKESCSYLPEILAGNAAKIFEFDNGKIISSGAFKIVEHDNDVLKIIKNEHYHSSQPMIDEISIFRVPTDNIKMSFIRLLSKNMSEELNQPGKRKLAQEGCFSIINAKGQLGDEKWRRFLNNILQPVEILKQSGLSNDYSDALSFSTGLLPGWNHRNVDFSSSRPFLSINHEINIVTYDQPELIGLANGIANILAKHGMSARATTIGYREFILMDFSSYDIIISNFMIDYEDISAYMMWLANDNTLQCLPENERRKLEPILQKSYNYAPQKFKEDIESYFMNVTHERWIIPLFHHWIDFESNSAFTWRDPHTLGWPDFSNLWIE